MNMPRSATALALMTPLLCSSVVSAQERRASPELAPIYWLTVSTELHDDHLAVLVHDEGKGFLVTAASMSSATAVFSKSLPPLLVDIIALDIRFVAAPTVVELARFTADYFVQLGLLESDQDAALPKVSPVLHVPRDMDVDAAEPEAPEIT